MIRTKQRAQRRRHRPGTLIPATAAFIGITAGADALPYTGGRSCLQASRARRRRRG